MSLNRTLARLSDEVRREARRNPQFADRLDTILRAHASARRIASEDEVETLATPAEETESAESNDAAPILALNPIAICQREGADGLRERLSGPEATLEALRALLQEHNLDPAGVTLGRPRDEVLDHIVEAAVKRLERDRKLFDY